MTHLGRFPLLDHFCDGARGLQYLGKTFGYFRRGVRPFNDKDSDGLPPVFRTTSARSSFARRSSGCYSLGRHAGEFLVELPKRHELHCGQI
jgi:hypothetical protein